MIGKSLFFLGVTLTAFSMEKRGLVDPSYIRECLTKQARWGGMHGAFQEDLGAGMFYYGLVYANKSSRCVCLGSGDGFVPRVMRQAQRDLQLENSETILIDGNTGRWGKPEWLGQTSFLRTAFPDIHIILNTTQSAVKELPEDLRINYLHIDADRTVKGAFQDFVAYLPFMEKNSFITLHDTAPKQPCTYVVHLIREMGYNVINFETLGTGVALIYIP